MNAPRILFRCDGGQTHGLGHLTRCLSLARSVLAESPQAQVAFWGNYDNFARSLLTQHGMTELTTPVPANGADSIASTRTVCAGFDVLVLDSYTIDQHYIDGLKQQPFRLALIDDDQRHDLVSADLVVCFRAGAQRLDYGSRQQLLGTSYLLVKPELRVLREHNLSFPPDRAIERVLVFLSGSSAGAEHLPTVLQALDSTGIEVAYLSPGEPRSHIQTRARHLALTPTIESVYAQADFVICGGGLTKYECAYAGIANACLSLTALQDEDTQAMAAQGLTLDLGLAATLNPTHLRRQIVGFMRNPEALAAQRRAFATKLHSDGSRHVARALLSL